ncbi:polysaccharide biosynthesis tyrosine autokinase [Blastococcus sp. TML/M2B]|uniref:polysaccharide biosynthesis tyrosine autokinase n=1 Tax=unclassified Blastococcus TaxID=2619396 RepID=UPI00190B69C5|nr:MULTISPECIES: polysaccharide biosynthesis tyrosine autokinase [unclassified Blastococcus]MBN1091281.1 polysaccharide biosynthesis tyrosine autokinase [Blastococcus sp. TML/M2B]MBN1095161.1 polysaccharide biosynthesis tyrosine autokinase [Blastococcus sp. TML/C7B]
MTGLIRRYGRLVLAGVLAGLVVAGLLSWTAEKTYTSSTQLWAKAAGPTASSDAYEGNLFTQERINSYPQVLTSPDLTSKVVDELGLDETPEELAGRISVAVLPESIVLDVRVTDSTPQGAQAIARSLGEQFKQRVAELETPAGATASTVEVTTIKAPTFEPDPAGPDLVGNLWRGAALGLLLGLALAVVRSRTDRTVRTDDDVEAAAGAHVVGRLFSDRSLGKQAVLDQLDGQRPLSEAFRALRLNLRHLAVESPPKVVVVSGPLLGEGASTVAVNLSLSLATAGHRVILVDGDLRRPRVSRYLGLPDGPGLTDVLSGAAQLQDVVQTGVEGRLTVLGAGPMPPDPEAALGSPRMKTVLDVLRNHWDFVIIDAPPLLPVVDGAVLSALADSCLLVARHGRTKREHLAEAAASVARVHVPSLGVVLNRIPRNGGDATPGSRPYKADARRRANATTAAHTEPEAGSAAGNPDHTAE